MKTDGVHILLAEDDRDDRLFFKNAFKDLKIQNRLTICEDGISLMDYLKGAEPLPDILFLDLNMPGKSGMDCLKEIRANLHYRDMSIAIYTSLSHPSIHEDTLSAGANVFIRKPNDLGVLKKILLEVMYINWQYMVDGLNKENFMISYQSS
ncbi:MAG: response regulator [Bacteroidia bacterium]